MSNEVVLPAQVLWAQNENLLYVTIVLEDCKDPKIELLPEKFYFKSVGGTEKKTHEVTLNFYEKVKPDESKHVVRDRTIDFTIIKEEKKWWPRLLKDTKKYHWLKVDFNKWKDESESEDEKKVDFSYDALQNMVYNSEKNKNFDYNEDDEKFDESDEDLPDLVDEKKQE